jgi:hypothetical protein
LSGFFSTGSTQNPLERPYDVSTTWSATRPDEAQPALALVKSACPRAHITLDPVVVEAVPPPGRHRERVVQTQLGVCGQGCSSFVHLDDTPVTMAALIHTWPTQPRRWPAHRRETDGCVDEMVVAPEY